jgi:hypothetical protein
MANRIQKVSLEKVAQEELGKQTVNDIDAVELEVWEHSEPGLSLEVNKKTIRFRLNYSVSTKRFLTGLGGISAVVAGTISILKWLTPMLVAYFAHPPP